MKVLPFLLAAVLAVAGRAAEPMRLEANVPDEIPFTAAHPHADSFNEVKLDVTFTDPAGTVRKVPAFWAGGAHWKVRYASPLIGAHRWRSACSDAADAGLHGVEGAVEVAPYSGDNPFFQHGPVRVAADARHFEHADGTPFFWLGDTFAAASRCETRWRFHGPRSAFPRMTSSPSG